MLARTLLAGIDRTPLAGASRPMFVISSTTPAGRAAAAAMGAPSLAGVFHFPLDWTPIVRRTMRAVRPAALTCIETEIWPALLSECARSSLPVLIVNGRISDRSFRRYRRIGSFIGEALRAIRLACMQSEEDAARIRALGLSPDRVVVTGNMKFDAVAPAEGPGGRPASGLSWEPRGPVLVAGSTSPGEEEMVLDAVALAGLPGLITVIAPRHPDRFEEVARILRSRGVAFARRSQPRAGDRAARTLLLDTVGELAGVYGLASVAFVGGSLVPRGGQNLMEPAARGVPVLFGPHTENFAGIAEALIRAGGGFRVTDPRALAARIGSLIADEPARLLAGAAGRSLIEGHRGATDRTIEHLRPWIAA